MRRVLRVSLLYLCAVSVTSLSDTSLTALRFEENLWTNNDISKREAAQTIGAWTNNPVLNLTCGDTAFGPRNPILSCVNRIEVTLKSSQHGDVVVKFDRAQLDTLKVAPPADPDSYVIPLPLFKYAKPNVLYGPNNFLVIFVVDGSTKNGTIGQGIYNQFNASSSSLREYYGVPGDIVGTDRVAQAASLMMGGMNASVNSTTIAAYRALRGIEPAELQFPDWVAVPSIVSRETSNEFYLDIQTLFTTAPGATTYAIPTMLPLDELERALHGAGLSEENIKETLLAFQWYDPSAAPGENLTALLALGEAEIQAAGNFYSEYLRAFAKNVTASTTDAPQVLSWSWNTGLYRAAGVSFEVLEEVLETLTLHGGISVLVATGDSGASGDGTACLPPGDPLIGNQDDMWPIVSPWVTTVGGTQFLAMEGNPQAEVVCSSATTMESITSGGGFTGPKYPSNLFSVPAWQKTAVDGYLAGNNVSTFAGFPTEDTPGFNARGRAFPDVSIYAAGIAMLDSQNMLSVGSGTSFSTPFLASIFTMANEQLLAAGYDTIGYANPMLYWMGENCTEALVDVTVGNNQADKYDGDDCLFGYPAARGWDAATGLGTIRFEPFVACAMRYQDEVRSKGLELLPNGSYRAVPNAPLGSAAFITAPFLSALVALINI